MFSRIVRPSRFSTAVRSLHRFPVRKMHIQSIPMWSDNYAYLVVDDKTKDAVIIDPASPEEVVPVLKKAIQDGSIKLKAIVNTHHHRDHAGGNQSVRSLLNLKDLPIIGGRDCDAVTSAPAHGQGFKIGDGISVTGYHTPCHTQDSVCWFMEDGNDKVVFAGDTLFTAGTGEEMDKALNHTLGSLPDDTRVYPGHEYTKSNIKFGISVLENEATTKLKDYCDKHAQTQGVFTIGDEKAHNVFMRLHDPIVQKATGETEPSKVISKLREMKNNFR